MSNVRSVDEAKRRLDEMAAEFSGKKPDLSAGRITSGEQQANNGNF